MFSYVDLVRAEIALDAEERFGITIPDEETDNWLVLGDVARTVAGRAGALATEAEIVDWVRTLLVECYGARELMEVGPEVDVFSDYDRATAWFFARGRGGDPGSSAETRVASYYCAYGVPSDLRTIPSAWRTDTVVTLARRMSVSRDFSILPILADALQEAGCDNEVMLNHCRNQNATHIRGCWVVDLVFSEGRYRAELPATPDPTG